MTCHLMFDMDGNLIRETSHQEHEDEEYKPRSISPETDADHINQEGDRVSKNIAQIDSMTDMVFPNLPHNHRTTTKDARWRLQLLRKTNELAKAAFPANYTTTYADAWTDYRHFRGVCHHDEIYRRGSHHCHECEDYNTMLISRHATDYQINLAKTEAAF
jgi:hypothetical protein